MLAALSLFGATYSTAQPLGADPVTTRATIKQPAAQSITIQVVDGRSGRPLPASAIRVECGASSGTCPGISFFVPLPETGPGQLTLAIPSTATALWIDAADDEHTFCAGGTPDATNFSVASIRSTGLVGANECGQLPASVLRRWQPQPGRVVVFVTRRSFWHKLLPYC